MTDKSEDDQKPLPACVTDALPSSGSDHALAHALRDAAEALVMFHKLGWTEAELNGALRRREALFDFDNPRPVGAYVKPDYVPPDTGIPQRFSKPADDAPDEVWSAWLDQADRVAEVTNDASLTRLAAQLRLLRSPERGFNVRE